MYFLGTIQAAPVAEVLHDEPDPVGRRGLDLLHLVLEELGAAALVAIEGELHVLRGDRVTVVELGILAEDELVGDAVLGQRPGLGQARGADIARHGFEQRVVQGVQHHERGDEGLGLTRIEPARDERHVDPDDEGPVGRGGQGRGQPAERREKQEEDQDLSGHAHGSHLPGDWGRSCDGPGAGVKN
jgi:hypothetical protein